MRWLFLVVLSLNLTYIVWQTSKPSTDPYINVQPLKNVQPIVLLSELKQQKPADLVTTAPQSTQESAQQPVQQSSWLEGEAENISDEQAVSDQASAQQEEVAETASELTIDKDVVVAEVKEPDVEEPNIEDAEVKEPGSNEVSQVKPSQSESCYTLGPFRDLDKLRSLTREIKSYVDTTDFRGSEEKEPTLYWVYIKPEKNRKKAIATGKRLKAKKIKDFYVIRDGEKINGISLGYFRNKDGASGLVKKVKKLGFDVVLEPVIKTHTIYWLDYQVSGGKSIPQAIFDKHFKSTKKDKISRLSRDCGA